MNPSDYFGNRSINVFFIYKHLNKCGSRGGPVSISKLLVSMHIYNGYYELFRFFNGVLSRCLVKTVITSGSYKKDVVKPGFDHDM